MDTQTPETGAVPGPATPVRAALGWTVRRWPTWVAIALSVATWGGGAAGLGEVLPLLPLIYLVMAVIGRRHATWPVLVVLVAGYTAVEFQDVVRPSTVVLAAAALVLVVGTVRWHRLPSRRMYLLQVSGMVAFAAVALVGLALAPEVGQYVVAAGWLAHGVWDFAHLRAHKVVSRSYAECCGVIDVLVAVGLVLQP